jgi:hypothetical protein
MVLDGLVHFFEHGGWGSPVETAVEGQSLTAQDQLFVLMQGGLYLTHTAAEGYSAPAAQICYERAESLCDSLNHPLLLYAALLGLGRWRYSLLTGTLTTTLQVAQRVYSLAREQTDSALMIGAYHALAGTLYFIGDFKTARRFAERGVQLWRAGGAESHAEEVLAPTVVCLWFVYAMRPFQIGI